MAGTAGGAISSLVYGQNTEKGMLYGMYGGSTAFGISTVMNGFAAAFDFNGRDAHLTVTTQLRNPVKKTFKLEINSLVFDLVDEEIEKENMY